jgi:tetratricopeptide (TPR) repeat protein
MESPEPPPDHLRVIGFPSADTSGGDRAWLRCADSSFAWVMEVILLALVCGAPLFWGAPARCLLLYAALTMLLVLWGGRLLLQGRLVLRKCPVTVCLGLLFLAAIGQLISLPAPLIHALAPANAQVYEHLVPAQQEILAGEQPGRDAISGATISLYPHATRDAAMALLAVFLLFAVARNNFPPELALRRLSMWALASGAILVIVLAFLSWFQPAHGVFLDADAAFGLRSREQLALYLQMSLGLGVGLLYSRLYQNGGAQRSEPGAGHQDSQREKPGRQTSGCGPLMSVRRAGRENAGRFDQGALWIGGGVLILIAGLASALSPAGLVAVGGAGATCYLLIGALSRKQPARIAGLLVAAVGLALWLAWDSVAAAGAVWARAFAFAQDFPLWGTGLGTFAQIASNQGFFTETEPASFAASPGVLMAIAVEGGFVRLVLSLLAVGLVFRLGCQSLRRHDPAGGLALGVLMGFSALVIHGSLALGQPTVPTPAVSLLAAIACAYLCGLADANQADAETSTRHVMPKGVRARSIHARGIVAATCGALVLFVLGVILSGHGWRVYRARNLTQDAMEVNAHDPSAERRLGQLESAVPLARADADFRHELALAHVRVYQERLAALKKSGRFLQAVQIANSLTVGGSFASPVPRIVAWHNVALLPWQQKHTQDYLESEHLVPAVRHWLGARGSNPLNPEFQCRIAAYHYLLRRVDAQDADKQTADTKAVYLERAMAIAPRDPRVFYQAGVQEMAAGQVNKALDAWKRALDLSDAFLGPILERSRHHLGPQEILRRLLANRPVQALAAADYLFPDGDSKERLPFLERIVELLSENPNPSGTNSTARDSHLAAIAQWSLGSFPKAFQAFQKALADEPRQTGWRYEFALFLYEHGKYQEAQSELLAILQQRPEHKRARNLLSRVSDRMTR